MDLRARFLALWDRCGAVGYGPSVWEAIERLYQGPKRCYHTLAHIEDLLVKLDEFLKEFPEFESKRDVLEWAIFFHDFTYEIRGTDNKQASATYVDGVLLRAGLAKEFREEVVALVLATKHQGIEGLSFLQLVMIELDLSILGARPDVFDNYERNVYREYVELGEVDGEIFRKGRKKILQGFLDRKPLFSISFFNQRYEKQAKENLLRSIAALS